MLPVAGFLFGMSPVIGTIVWAIVLIIQDHEPVQHTSDQLTEHPDVRLVRLLCGVPYRTVYQDTLHSTGDTL